MNDQSPDFTLEVGGVKGFCPVGESYAKQQMAKGAVPVLSCEGPCIRGDIARRAADLVGKEASFARACHGESFFVPHSAMATWVKTADKVLMVDGCFLKCHGRVLENLVPEEKIVHVDAMAFYKKYCDIFHMDEVPEEERAAVAKEVADHILPMFKEKQAPSCGCSPTGCSKP